MMQRLVLIALFIIAVLASICAAYAVCESPPNDCSRYFPDKFDAKKCSSCTQVVTCLRKREPYQLQPGQKANKSCSPLLQCAGAGKPCDCEECTAHCEKSDDLKGCLDKNCFFCACSSCVTTCNSLFDKTSTASTDCVKQYCPECAKCTECGHQCNTGSSDSSKCMVQRCPACST